MGGFQQSSGSVTSLDGKKISLQDYKPENGVMVMDFLLLYCP